MDKPKDFYQDESQNKLFSWSNRSQSCSFKQIIRQSNYNLQSYQIKIDEGGQNTEQNSSNIKQIPSSSTQKQSKISELVISRQSFIKNSGNFSKQSIIYFQRKIVFVKKVESKHNDKKQIFNNELKIMQAIKGKNIALDLILYDKNSQKLYLVAGDKDLKTIMNIIKEEKLYKDTVAYEQFVVEIYLQILDKLRKLHDLGIGHSDIKPSNIMMGYDGSIYLVDYGASAFLEKNLDKYLLYRTKEFNFPSHLYYPKLSQQEAKVCDFTQLLITTLYLFVLDDESSKYFEHQQFSECTDFLLQQDRNKNSQFLPKLKILIDFYQNFDIHNPQEEPDIFMEFLNHDMGLFNVLFDFQHSKEGIIFIKYIRDENLPLIAFLCSQNSLILELQNKCKIRISCELKDLGFLMEKLNISESSQFTQYWQVDYKQLPKQQKTSQIHELTDTLPLTKLVDLETIQQTHEELNVQSIILSRNSTLKEKNKKEQYQNQYQEQNGKVVDEGKCIVPPELYDLLEYIVKKIIIQIIYLNNRQIFEQQEYLFLDYKTYLTHRIQLNYQFIELNIDASTLNKDKPVIPLSGLQQIDKFIEKYHPQQLIQLIKQIANMYPEIKYYQVFYKKCKINQTHLKSIFLYEVAKFLESNKTKIKVYLSSYYNCIQRELLNGDNNLIPEIMYKLENTYEKDNQFNKALEFSFKISNFFENIQIEKNEEFIIRSNTNKAYQFMNVGKLQHSIFYLQKALDYSKNIKDVIQIQVSQATAYCKMAYMLQLLKDFNLALEKSEKGLNIRKVLAKRGQLDYKKQYAISLRNYGIVFLQHNSKPDRVILKKYFKSFEIYVNSVDFFYFRQCLVDLANAFLKTGQYQQTQKVIEYALMFQYIPEKQLERSIFEVNQKYKKSDQQKVLFSIEEEVLSYLDDIQVIIINQNKNDQNEYLEPNYNQDKMNNKQDQRDINYLHQLQYELDFECGKKNKIIAIQQLEKCADEKELIYGEQYNMQIFGICCIIQRMCTHQNLYDKSLYYSRKMLQILLYLNQSDNCSDLKNNDFPNFYVDLIQKTFMEIIDLQEKVNNQKMADNYKQLLSKFSEVNNKSKQIKNSS